MTREATAADLDRLLGLEAACFPHDAWTRAMLAEELERPGARFLVGEDDAGLYGFAIGLVVMDELNVLQVGVDPARRGRGLGSVLMRALHASAPHQGVSWLEVRATNTPAIRMYDALGYSVVSVRRRYYADGEDAVIMRLSLGG